MEEELLVVADERVAAGLDLLADLAREAVALGAACRLVLLLEQRIFGTGLVVALARAAAHTASPLVLARGATRARRGNRFATLAATRQRRRRRRVVDNTTTIASSRRRCRRRRRRFAFDFVLDVHVVAVGR